MTETLPQVMGAQPTVKHVNMAIPALPQRHASPHVETPSEMCGIQGLLRNAMMGTPKAGMAAINARYIRSGACVLKM
jgi:hypothetical protein